MNDFETVEWGPKAYRVVYQGKVRAGTIINHYSQKGVTYKASGNLGEPLGTFTSVKAASTAIEAAFCVEVPREPA